MSSLSFWRTRHSGRITGQYGERRAKPACCRGCKSPTGKEVANPSWPRVFQEEVWGYENFPTTRTVDTHLVRLRQTLEPDPEQPQYFLTVHGTGYRFVG